MPRASVAGRAAREFLEALESGEAPHLDAEHNLPGVVPLAAQAVAHG